MKHLFITCIFSILSLHIIQAQVLEKTQDRWNVSYIGLFSRGDIDFEINESSPISDQEEYTIFFDILTERRIDIRTMNEMNLYDSCGEYVMAGNDFVISKDYRLSKDDALSLIDCLNKGYVYSASSKDEDFRVICDYEDLQFELFIRNGRVQLIINHDQNSFLIKGKRLKRFLHFLREYKIRVGESPTVSR